MECHRTVLFVQILAFNYTKETNNALFDRNEGRLRNRTGFVLLTTVVWKFIVQKIWYLFCEILLVMFFLYLLSFRYSKVYNSVPDYTSIYDLSNICFPFYIEKFINWRSHLSGFSACNDWSILILRLTQCSRVASADLCIVQIY